MNPKPADLPKFVAGCSLALLCVILTVFFVARDQIENTFVAIFMAVVGSSFAFDAWKKKEMPPSISWIRWHHVLSVVIIVGLSVFAIYRLAAS